MVKMYTIEVDMTLFGMRGSAMFNETIQTIGSASFAKSNAAKESPLRYITASMLAGGFVGLGIILIFSIGAPFGAVSSPAVKILMGVSFGVAYTYITIVPEKNRKDGAEHRVISGNT